MGLQDAEAPFRTMSEADRVAAKACRVRMAPFPREGLSDLACAPPLPRAEAQLWLIKGVYGDGSAQPKPKDLAKVVN